MSDELTPEEQKAFDSLPRERMPAGLPAGMEERVVDAMREHGVLAKRRRMVELTNSRVAAVLAASVALVIGAYSIGLNRGGGEVPVPLQPVSRETAQRAEPPEEMQLPRRAKPESAPPSEAFVDADTKKNTSETKMSKDLAASDSPAPQSHPATAEREDRARSAGETDALAKEETEAAAPAATLSESPQAASKAGRVQVPSAMLDATVTAKQTLTILLDGSLLTVEADSTRVTEDKRGRILIIYTRDGAIRIRLVD